MAYRGIYYLDWMGHIVGDILACVMIGFQLSYAIRSGHRGYLRWIVPNMISIGLATLYRIVTLVWMVARLPSSSGSSYLFLFILDIQEIIALVGCYLFTSQLISGKFGVPPSIPQFPPRPTGVDPNQWPPEPRSPEQ